MVAISTDGIQGASQMKGLVSAEYPVLADPGAVVAKAYGVFDLLGDGVSAPAAYIIDKDRSILWSYVGSSIGDRANPQRLLATLAELEGR